LTWTATYLSSGQIQSEKDSNGGSNTRSSTYTYYPAGDRWAGLLSTVTDGRGVRRTNAYDNFLRTASVSTAGAALEQNMSVSWHYDARGLATNITQAFATNTAGPATVVNQGYDTYGRLNSDSVLLEGAVLAGANQSWDEAGRRTQLSVLNAPSLNFQYRADGRMKAVNNGTFSYADNGLMVGRTNAFRSHTVLSRDGTGRPLQEATYIPLQTPITENWTWTGDGLPATYTIGPAGFNNTWRFGYDFPTRRLTNEAYNVSASQAITNAYAFDQGQANGLGVMTLASQSGSTAGAWTVASTNLDAFQRVKGERNTILRRMARGTVNGPATLRGNLNGQSIDLRYNPAIGGAWSSELSLKAGPNTLTVYADHPSGYFTTNRVSAFTVTNTAADAVETAFDDGGFVTSRVWKDSKGTVIRTQGLTWDAFGRLVKQTERDAGNNGYNWQADFDPLGRRLRTVTVPVTNNLAITAQQHLLVHFYDPQVEFLEVGLSVNGKTTWKTYGPDLDGAYGGEQGLGGLESLTTDMNSVGVIQDGFGNVLGSVANGLPTWNASRVNLYGPVDGYAALSLSTGPLSAEHLAWRGKWRDEAGYYYWAARPYEAERRAFLSADPLGHAATPSLYSAFRGNPASYWDPDGRCANPSQQNGITAANVFGANGGNVNYQDLLAWGMQNPNANINGNDNASRWMAAGQAMGNGTLSNPQYIDGYTDQFGHNYQTFCYSCHDPNDPFAQLKLGAAYNTINTSIPAFLAQNALAFVPAEGMMGEAGTVVNTVVNATRMPLLLTEGTLGSRVSTAYQNFYNDAWTATVNDFNQGSLTIPADQSWRSVLGQRTDAAARDMLKDYLNAQGIPEGPGAQVLVNRRLFVPR